MHYLIDVTPRIESITEAARLEARRKLDEEIDIIGKKKAGLLPRTTTGTIVRNPADYKPLSWRKQAHSRHAVQEEYSPPVTNVNSLNTSSGSLSLQSSGTDINLQQTHYNVYPAENGSISNNNNDANSVTININNDVKTQQHTENNNNNSNHKEVTNEDISKENGNGVGDIIQGITNGLIITDNPHSDVDSPKR